MEDLYGKTVTKGLTQETSKFARTANLGRLTPIQTNNNNTSLNNSKQQQQSPQQLFSSLSGGRLTPCETSFRVPGKQLGQHQQQLGGHQQQLGHHHGQHPQLHQQHSNGILNLSSHNSSKLSSTNSGANSSQTKTTMDMSNHDLNSTQISPISATRKALIDMSHSSQINGGPNVTRDTMRRRVGNNLSNVMLLTAEAGVREMIQSLGLLCLVSLLLALLSLIFLLKISPMPERSPTSFLSVGEYVTVYEVAIAMCSLTLCLNLSCLLVCTIQFLFAVKLIKSSQGRLRTTKYLKKAGLTRVCAVVGFFLSIPLFLIGVVLFSFIHFNSTPAIVTSVIIGLGIVFCGAAVVHNVFIWQREKTKNRRESNTMLGTKNLDTYKQGVSLGQLSHITLPQATLDLSTGISRSLSARGLELSTLV